MLSGSAVHCLGKDRVQDEFSKRGNELMRDAEMALQNDDYSGAEKAYRSAADMFGKAQSLYLNADVIENVRL